ncbi:class I SAM-dependent methyltransferase [Methanobrevibacter sp.]
MKCLKISLPAVDEVRKIIMDMEVMDMDHRIKPEKVYGYIGITSPISDETIEDMKKEVLKVEKVVKLLDGKELEIEVVEKDLELIPRYPHSVREMLEGKLTEEEFTTLRNAFDIIGRVVIVEIPENLLKHKQLIGETTLEFTKRDSVYMKKSAIKGVTRVREIEFLCGKDNPITIHKEQKIRLKLDVSKVYFSPRLTSERKRIREICNDGENILDMFCGVGPFPIVIGSKNKVDITAVDINEIAIKYLKENIKLNKLKANITPICGDINKVADNQLAGEKFDRIIMNLPGTSYNFLDTAFDLIKDKGIIHYYEFAHSCDEGKEKLEKKAALHNMHIKIEDCHKVRSTSPGMWQMAFDCRVFYD